MEEKPFQIDVDKWTKGVPFLLQGKAKEILNAINKADLNHDGKSDIAQAVKLYFVLQSVGGQINAAVDFDQFADWLVAQAWVKDQAVAREAIKELCGAIERADDK